MARYNTFTIVIKNRSEIEQIIKTRSMKKARELYETALDLGYVVKVTPKTMIINKSISAMISFLFE